MFIVIILCLLFLCHYILVMLLLLFSSHFSCAFRFSQIWQRSPPLSLTLSYSFLREFQLKATKQNVYKMTFIETPHKQFKWISNPYNSCSNWYHCIGTVVVVYIFHFNSNFTTSIDDVPHIQWKSLCELSKESEKNTKPNRTIAAALAHSISCAVCVWYSNEKQKHRARLYVFCIFG